MSPVRAEASRIVVVGGGFTGAALVVHLLRAARHALAITVVEPAAVLGRGIAYGTDDPLHRINVPSDRMGLFAADPHGFTRWLFARGHLPDAGSHDGAGHHYVPRRLYGAYVAETLDDVVDAAAPSATLVHRRARATSVTRRGNGWAVRLDDGATLMADAVALASGHALPQAPCSLDDATLVHPRFVANPWAPGALDGIGSRDSVLVVGTGLTMADAIARLRGDRHAGPITAVSRRGLLPQPHGAFDRDYDLFAEGPAPATALSLLRWLRGRMRAAAPDLGWQTVADAFRSELPTIWGALPASEKQRVLRRLLPFWEVHRFRIAPQVQEEIVEARRAGALTVEKAALVGLTHDGRFQARLRRPGGRCDTRSFDAVVLCTGPQRTIAADPLVAALLADGLARLDAAGLGLAVDAESRICPPHGPALSSFRAFGPATRGTFGEMTGAPDITKHLEHVAQAWMGAPAEVGAEV